MKALNLQIKKGKKAYYLRLADAIRQAIKIGQIRPGEYFPSARVLATELQCHRHTVMAAINELMAEGWINSQERKGYIVSKDLPQDYFISRPTAKSPESSPHVYNIARDIVVPRRNATSGMKYSFQSGMPDLRLFPYDELRSCFSDSLKSMDSALLSYGEPFGHAPFIEEISCYLRRVRSITNRKIIITHGSQEAIFIIGQLLLSPGDNVAVEELGYPPAWAALKSTGARLVGIPVDHAGMDTEALEKILKRRKIALIYTTPLHQYPTTVTLPIDRRLKLYQLAAKYNVPILEDDYDHEFHFRSQPLAPLAGSDPSGLVLYVSTFSKVLYPSARLGFMAIPEQIFNRLSDFKRIISSQNNTLTQDAIARWMRDGGLERHMRKMRRIYQLRRDCMAEILSQSGMDFTLPDGGMALWVDTKVNSARLAQRANEKGVFIMPAQQFSLDGKLSQLVRLGYANQSPDEIKRGLNLILQLL